MLLTIDFHRGNDLCPLTVGILTLAVVYEIRKFTAFLVRQITNNLGFSRIRSCVLVHIENMHNAQMRILH